MKIRFLETWESDVAGVPFQAGQLIEVPGLTSALRRAIKENRAEVVREEPEIETAMVNVKSQHPRRSTRRRAS